MDIMNSLESLSNELFDAILSQITSKRELNFLSQTSRSLYHRTTPKLYQSWSYHGLHPSLLRPVTKHCKLLRQFLETINFRPDLAAHVKELDIREWGDCPRVEHYLGMMDGYYIRVEKEKQEKRERQRGTLMDDFVFGEESTRDEDDENESSYEESESEEYSDDEEEVEDIDMEEVDFLGPVQPFDHTDCLEGQCTASTPAGLRRAGKDYEREDMLVDYRKIWLEEDADEHCHKDPKEEDELIIMLFNKLPNLKIMWMVMPEVPWSYDENVLCKFLEDTKSLISSGTLQKLETLYICSPMHQGGIGHREYELDLRSLLPFMYLPNLRSLHTLTTYIDRNSRNPPVDYAPLKHTSNITHLTYDESALDPFDVISSLSMFKALKSFRWTTEPSGFGCGDGFVGFQSSFGTALSAHKGTLEELYFDNRHSQNDGQARARQNRAKDAILIGSLKEYPRLRKLAIDVNSLVGHQAWTPNPIALVDVLPTNLSELTLFVNILQVETPESRWTVFENQLFSLAFLNMLRNAASKLPKLRKVRIELTRDREIWRTGEMAEIELESGIVALKQVKEACEEVGIGFEVAVAVEGCSDDVREVGNTTIPYFLEQIKMRNPGRDF
ncbi:uncharacterized protein PAC_06300 [Phialocephala subalpina]|uniref:Uncharacterized protein n=1 Tax=Phialocephala subalpina TaxID=576137 RepID=A0A1L7WUF0_9HELO|nr:uncharacterized protein PAC_06300 [Phialocephala subalpina]